MKSLRLLHCAVVAVLFSVTAAETETSTPTVKVTVRVVATEGSAAPPLAQLVATASPGSAPLPPKPVFVQRVAVPSTTPLDLDAGAEWAVTASSDGFWCETKIVRPSASAGVDLVLYPSGLIAGSAELPTEGPSPAHLTVRLIPGVSAQGPPVPGEPETEIRCPIEERRFRCETPAGLFDLRVGAAGFVPTYLWSVAIAPHRTTELPATLLRRGSSVSGWVVFAVPPPQRTTCRVELVVADTGAPRSPEFEARRSELSLQATVNRRGFFQFSGVQPGRYQLKANAPGLIAASTPSIDVSESLEAQLAEPIRMAPPVRLTVVLDPPRSVSGEPWTLSLAREEISGPRLTTAGKASAEDSGQARFDGLAPGKYWLTVTDRLQQRWLDEPLVVEHGMPTQFVHIPTLDLEGTLILGKSPTEGIVLFHGKADNRRVFCKAGDEGHFRCVLPGPGRWAVDVQVKGSRAREAIDPVEIGAPPPGGVATVEIVVPDRPLAGTVVDERGQPVAGAQVRFVHLDDSSVSQTVTNDQGEFEIRSVAVGPASLQAMAKGGVSETRSITIEEEKAPDKVKLTIKPRAVLQGHVISPFGPVAGAFVDAIPDLVPGTSVMMIPRTTGVDGSFRIESLAQSAGANLIVVAPGFGARLFRVVLDQLAGSDIDVNVDPARGVISVTQGPAAPSAGGPSFWLVHDGGLFTSYLLAAAGLLRTAPASSGAVATILDLAPGDYTVCARYPASAGSGNVANGLPSSGSCASGYLTPGGVLELKVGN